MQGKPKELKLASEVKPAVAPETRQLCAGRLISLIDAVSKAAATPDPPAGAGGPGKGKTKKRKAAEMEATAAAAGAAAAEAVLAARLESAYLAEIPAFVSKVGIVWRDLKLPLSLSIYNHADSNMVQGKQAVYDLSLSWV